MAGVVLPIARVTPSTVQPWTSKVMILEKAFPREPICGAHKYQRLIIVDRNGTRAQATIFGRDIDLLQNTLIVFNNYYISNAVIRYIDPRYRVVPHPNQWIITGRTIIREVVDDPIPVHMPYDFVAFPTVPTLRNTARQIDIIAAVVKDLPPRMQQTRNGLAPIQEFLLMDTEFNTLVLTMWNQFVANEAAAISTLIEAQPIIVGLRLKAVSYNGVSLSSRTLSSFLINPDIPQAVELRSFLLENAATVNAVVAATTFQSPLSTTTVVEAEEISIAELISSPDHVVYSITCSITPINLENQPWYMGCSNCYRATSADNMEPFSCHNCGMPNTHSIPRARLEACIQDTTANVKGTLFGPSAEQVLGCTAEHLLESLLEAPNTDFAALINSQTQYGKKVYARGCPSYIPGQNRRYNLSLPLPAHDEAIDPLLPLVAPQIQSEIVDQTQLQLLPTAHDAVVTATVANTANGMSTSHTEQEETDELIIWKGKAIVPINSIENTAPGSPSGCKDDTSAVMENET